MQNLGSEDTVMEPEWYRVGRKFFLLEVCLDPGHKSCMSQKPLVRDHPGDRQKVKTTRLHQVISW